MFKWQYDKVFRFSLTSEDGRKIPVSEWFNQPDFTAHISILNELVDNGFAEYQRDCCIVETENIYRLIEIDKQILELPEAYPYEIYIQSDGQLNQNSFKFRYGFYDFTPNGTILSAKRNGAVISIDGREYLLSKNQFLVCEALDKFNILPETDRTFQNNLLKFADIKTLTKDAALLLDSYLENENVYHPDKIKIDLKFQDGILEIIPQVGIENEQGFTKAFDTYTEVKEVYPVADEEGKRTRIIINHKQKEQLEKIKNQFRKVTDSNKVKEIVDNPATFFDDEIVDISIFYSERVIDIGVYTPKYYPFVCPYKSEWIPGLTIDSRVDGTKRIFFKDKFELEEFEQEKEQAVKSGRKAFKWKNSEIPVEEAERFIKIVKKQFANPKKPVKEEIQDEGSGKKVLIIEENAVALGYREAGCEPISDIEHTFSQIPNLASSIRLKDHQIEGIAWLQNLGLKKLSGCLLADDMGLGKTLQVLYFIEWHSQKSTNNDKPYLIVAPVSLLENWEDEYSKYFDSQTLPLTRLYENITIPREFNRASVEKLQKRQIILTNYETLRLYQFNLCAVDYSIAVLDEAQKIKTPGTLVTNVAKAIKADFKIAMTGTPVENTLVDLWCIMDFAVPGLLGNAKDFAEEFQARLKNGNVNIKELGEDIRKRIGVFIKRRLKNDVLKDLPQKFLKPIPKPMPPVQIERYKIEIEQAKNQNLEGVDRRNQILKSLWAIRDISDHPYLLDNKITSYKSEELVSSSAKLKALVEILSDIKNKNEKVIVFADRKETQKMLQQVIYDYFNVLPRIINGDTPATKKEETHSKLSRQQTINYFEKQDGFNIIIMSQLAAGIGLNVTAANHVIHYSRHWNPAKEEQATDRAYRIGQTKDVYVYYPMAVSDEFTSFDLVLDKLLERKKSLAANTLFPTEQTEVRPDEIFEDVFKADVSVEAKPYSFEQVCKLTPLAFEAFTASLYSKMGFNTFLTPVSNDKGVDVVAIKKGGINYLIQSKQSKSPIGITAIQEIAGAKAYYETKFNERFELVIFTNSTISNAAKDLSKPSNIQTIEISELQRLIAKYPITIKDIYKAEKQRMEKI